MPVPAGLAARRLAWSLAATVALATLRLEAVARLASADGQFWDIQDTSSWSQDSGGIATGGRAYPFNGFGYLKIRVRTGSGVELVPNQYLTGFGLAHDGAERVDSITPVVAAGIVIGRAIFAPKESNYLRYLDRYTNAAAEDRLVDVAWGGASGAFEDGGPVAVATTSNGDRRIDLADLRDGDAERAARERTGARAVRSRSVGSRSWIPCGRSADWRRRHVRESVHRSVARLRSRAHRVRVHAHDQTRPDGGVDDVRREGPERSLRSARRIPGADPGRHRGAEIRRAVPG
jgi:hypothetical protein